MKTILTTAGLVAVLRGIAQAHPGHGADGGSHSLAHYLTEPMHVVAGVTLLAVSAVVGAWLRRRLVPARVRRR